MSNTMNAADGVKVAERWPQHSMNCPAWKTEHGHDVNGEDCTCGLRWKTEIGTLQTLKDAWEKRAYEAEQRERVLREALEEIWKYAAYGTATKQKDVRGRQFGAIHAIALAALATPAPEQPSAPLTVQPSPNGVLVEDPTRNLSVLAVEQPLLVTCPFDGQQWRFHTQEQVGMFQKHLDWHAKEGGK